MPTAYCVKCKKKVEMTNPKVVKMKNGMYAYKGTHKDCGTGLYRIIGKTKPTA